MPKVSQANRILSVLRKATGPTLQTEIADKAKIPKGGHLALLMRRLTVAGLVEPGEGEKVKGHSGGTMAKTWLITQKGRSVSMPKMSPGRQVQSTMMYGEGLYPPRVRSVFELAAAL